jgi:DNA-binding CsgD family transcriptional regulator
MNYAPSLTTDYVTQNGSHTNLTKRENEILDYISKGFSTKQIAAALGISELTIDTHRKNMLRKSGARTSAELVHLKMSISVY